MPRLGKCLLSSHRCIELLSWHCLLHSLLCISQNHNQLEELPSFYMTVGKNWYPNLSNDASRSQFLLLQHSMCCWPRANQFLEIVNEVSWMHQINRSKSNTAIRHQIPTFLATLYWPLLQEGQISDNQGQSLSSESLKVLILLNFKSLLTLDTSTKGHIP